MEVPDNKYIFSNSAVSLLIDKNDKKKGKEMKNISLVLFEEIRKASAKLINETMGLFNQPDANGKTPVERLFDGIAEKIKQGADALSPEAIKIALSYHEISRETITFKELVEIIKRDYKLTQGMNVCVLKTQKENEFTEFDIMACSAEKEVLFDPQYPWCHIVVAVPDPEFLKMFGEKSMLVLK